MADPQKSAKKNKKKNKKKTSEHQIVNDVKEETPTQMSAGKENCNIEENLPQKVGMKTVIKDVEVTMTHCTPENTVSLSKSAKRRMRKKAAKQQLSVTSEETVADKEKPENLLNFIGNNIELVNHPEISVTVAKELQSASSIETTTAKDSNTETTSAPDAKKKRKKKKKKKSNAENTPQPNGATTTDEPTTPTYVKLPATDNNYVLIVSHENFNSSNNSNKEVNNSGKKVANIINHVGNSENKIAGEDKNVEKESDNSKTVKLTLRNSNGNGASSLFPIVAEHKTATLISEMPKLPQAESTAIVEQQDLSQTVNEPEPQKDESLLTKAQLKAERRAKQEAQRAAKQAKGNEKVVTMTSPSVAPKETIKPTPKSVEPKLKKETAKPPEKQAPRNVRLFAHLPQFKPPEVLNKHFLKACTDIHPSVLEIGEQYAKGIICGSNARCISLLAAFKDVIRDYVKSPEINFTRDLESKLQLYMNFLDGCRPLSVSMVNAVKFLKYQINHLPKEINEANAKEELCSFIDNFVREEILLAKEAIGNFAAAKIFDGDVILTFAFSSLVKDVLCKAHRQNKKFRVIVVDSRPRNEALKMLHCLVNEGIHCSYTLINAISYVMKEASKVIIGAHSLLSNGCVMSRIGSSQVALVASSYRVPVLVCCETYKFCERVLTDSFVYNELGNPENLTKTAKSSALKNWQDFPSLQLLNLLYDVTTPDLISIVITEKGALPCTSVPVVLRVRHAGMHE